ncbi:hypothetical protein NDU88_002612 [Pleurodeles waltl]|uniref:Uncharacterized protein n=1 Tax=Pleurodeles waltl TaxID=8319 RepID=A0AAV7MQ61_PLEWA|nr:hypothetical protein NDU88_002612 [Pleurodeles waltl]
MQGEINPTIANIRLGLWRCTVSGAHQCCLFLLLFDDVGCQGSRIAYRNKPWRKKDQGSVETGSELGQLFQNIQTKASKQRSE